MSGSLRLADRIEWRLPDAGHEDAHGNTVFDWNADAAVEPCHVGNPATSESNQARNTVTTSRLAILLPTTVGRSDARARWRGVEYEVDGEVVPITDLRGKVHHCEATLRRVTG